MEAKVEEAEEVEEIQRGFSKPQITEAIYNNNNVS